jgi:hypothetical protein
MIEKLTHPVGELFVLPSHTLSWPDTFQFKLK